MKKKVKNLIQFSVTASFFLYIFNHLIFSLALVKNLLSDKKGCYYNWRFGKVFYTKEGSGKPLLLIHDLEAENSSYEWHRIRKQLSKKYTVYCVDLPGCGRSDKPNVLYTGYFYVQFLESFIKNVIQMPVELCVTGRSSSFALLYTAQHQEYVSKITLINPSSFEEQKSTPDKKDKIYTKMIMLPLIGTTIYNYQVSIDKIHQKLSSAYFYSSRSFTKKDIDTFYESAHLSGASSRFLYASITAGYTNLPVTHVLKNLNVPVNIVYGSEKAGEEHTVKEYCRLNPAIQTVSIANTKQLPQLEKPHEILHQF